MSGHLLSIGECMVELSQAGDGLLRKGFAGDTFNTAWYARLCAAPGWQVDYLTALGDDQTSQDMLGFMAHAGIGTDAIRRLPGRMPGLYMIHLKDGERSFSYWRETAAARQLAADGDHLRRALESADLLYFSGITLAILPDADAETLLSELRRAKAAGKRVAFDPNIRPRLWKDRARMLSVISEGARASTLVLPSFDDEAQHFGDASVAATLDRYTGLGVADIVVKDGPNGATLRFAGREDMHVPATMVERIVDTTSAGDSFNGAFLAHYLEHGDPAAAAAFAAGIAARVIGEHGALIPREKLFA